MALPKQKQQENKVSFYLDSERSYIQLGCVHIRLYISTYIDYEIILN